MTIPAGGDPGTRRALARMGGLPPARPDQRYAPPHAPTVPPGSKNVFIGRLVIIEGPNDGLFFYSGAPGRGTLIAAAVAQPGTDPTGQNTVTPVLSVGQWSATTGLPGAQSTVDAQGDLSIQGPDGHTRLKIYTGTGAQNPGSAYFFNDFGAIVQVIDPTLGLFQYNDLGSASQGQLILAQAGKSVSDPVLSTAVLGGVTLANSSGNQLTQITSSNGRIRFNNVFGAAVSVIAPDVGGIFFYDDLGSATQGGTIGALVWSTVTISDPINGTSFDPGTTSRDPIAAGFLYYAPGNLYLGNQASMGPTANMGHVNGIGQGSGSSSRVYTGVYSPNTTFAPGNTGTRAAVLVEGTSPDGTNAAQVLMGAVTGTASPVPATSDFLEVQGNTTINGTLNIPVNAAVAHVGIDIAGHLYLFNAAGTGSILATWPAANSLRVQLNAGNAFTGRVPLRTIADHTARTVTQAVATNFASTLTILANDALEAGIVYRLELRGNGTQGANQQALSIEGEIDGAFPFSMLFPAAFAPVSQAFTWEAHIEIVVTAVGGAGVGLANLKAAATIGFGGVAGILGVVQTAQHNAQAWDTTASHTFSAGAAWGAVVGAPTITCDTSWFERVN